MANDPVCGMQVDEKKASAKTVYDGQTYYFCCNGCKTAFEKEPARYAGKAGASSGHGGHGGHGGHMGH